VRKGGRQLGEEPLEAETDVERALGPPSPAALGEERHHEQAVKGNQDSRAHNLFRSRYRRPTWGSPLALLTVRGLATIGYGPKVLVLRPGLRALECLAPPALELRPLFLERRPRRPAAPALPTEQPVHRRAVQTVAP